MDRIGASGAGGAPDATCLSTKYNSNICPNGTVGANGTTEVNGASRI